MPLVHEAGAAVVALTIDETGMAKTAQRKLEVARRIHDIVVGEYGLPPGALIFDALTFTLATGDAEYVDSAVETIEGIRLIKRELPGVLTSLGVSNVSFGLKPRARATCSTRSCSTTASRPGSTWRSSTRPRSRRTPRSTRVERELADDLVLNRRPDALQRVIEHFEAQGRHAGQRRRRRSTTTRTRRSRRASTTRSCAAARTASRPRSTRR